MSVMIAKGPVAYRSFGAPAASSNPKKTLAAWFPQATGSNTGDPDSRMMSEFLFAPPPLHTHRSLYTAAEIDKTLSGHWLQPGDYFKRQGRSGYPADTTQCALYSFYHVMMANRRLPGGFDFPDLLGRFKTACEQQRIVDSHLKCDPTFWNVSVLLKAFENGGLRMNAQPNNKPGLIMESRAEEAFYNIKDILDPGFRQHVAGFVVNCGNGNHWIAYVKDHDGCWWDMDSTQPVATRVTSPKSETDPDGVFVAKQVDQLLNSFMMKGAFVDTRYMDTRGHMVEDTGFFVYVVNK